MGILFKVNCRPSNVHYGHGVNDFFCEFLYKEFQLSFLKHYYFLPNLSGLLLGPQVRAKTFELMNPDGSLRDHSAIGKTMQAEMTHIQFILTMSLLNHLNKVAREPANMMTTFNLATVFGPNLLHCVTTARRPESVMTEMEHNNYAIKALIDNAISLECLKR